MITGKNIVNAGVMSGRSAQTLASLAEGVGEAERYERATEALAGGGYVCALFRTVPLLRLDAGDERVAALKFEVRVLRGAQRKAYGGTDVRSYL